MDHIQLSDREVFSSFVTVVGDKSNEGVFYSLEEDPEGKIRKLHLLNNLAAEGLILDNFWKEAEIFLNGTLVVSVLLRHKKYSHNFQNITFFVYPSSVDEQIAVRLNESIFGRYRANQETLLRMIKSQGFFDRAKYFNVVMMVCSRSEDAYDAIQSMIYSEEPDQIISIVDDCINNKVEEYFVRANYDKIHCDAFSPSPQMRAATADLKKISFDAVAISRGYGGMNPAGFIHYAIETLGVSDSEE